MNNPYESPKTETNEDKKYKQPIINWKLFFFALTVMYLPFIIMILFQYLLYPG